MRHVKDIYRISRENALMNKHEQLINFPPKFVQNKKN